MAIKIRLRQQGRTNRQTYRLVVTDIRNPRDGKYLEMVGWYNPFSHTAKDAVIDTDRIQFWVGQGAQITPSAQALITRLAPEVMKEIRAKTHTRRIKKAAKRRASKKKPVAAAKAKPAAPAPKKAAEPVKAKRKAPAKKEA